MGATKQVLVTLLVLLAGCSAAPEPVGVWVRARGGLDEGDRQSRVQAVTRSLLARCRERHMTVRVLDSDAVCAYGWPDGSLFVTRGLVDLFSDSEVVAAVAHELGHLLDDGHVERWSSPGHARTFSSLSGRAEGSSESLDAESRADFIAAELLFAEGLSPEALVSVLKKTRANGSASPSSRARLARRISLLSARLAAAVPTGQPVQN
jgi:Zn-dependent protease with chaperone function